jgi:hypothetical protein
MRSPFRGAGGRRDPPLSVGAAAELVLADPGMIAEKIKESAHPRRQRTALAKVDGVNVFAVAGIEILQHGNEPTGVDVGTDVE